MGTNYKIDDKYDLGRTHRFKDCNVEGLEQDLVALAVYSPHSLEEIQEIQERVEDMISSLLGAGRTEVLKMFQDQGAKVEAR